jgi:hypothetical protein
MIIELKFPEIPEKIKLFSKIVQLNYSQANFHTTLNFM